MWARKELKVRCSDSTLDDRADDIVEVGEFTFEIIITLFEDRPLFAGPNPTTGRLTVLRVERIGHVHSFNDSAERHKGFAIMRGAVISHIDEHLRRPSSRAGEAIRNP